MSNDETLVSVRVESRHREQIERLKNLLQITSYELGAALDRLDKAREVSDLVPVMRRALQLIAAGPLPDGSWGRDRADCHILARDALDAKVRGKRR